MRGIDLPPGDISVEAEGINEIVDRIPVLTKIGLRYTLNIPAGSRDTVDKALERHVSKCPTAQSLRESVEFEWTAEITEV